MRKEYYTALKTHLGTITPVQLIDYDLRQYMQRGDDVVRATPALYIGFKNIDWDQLPNNVQTSVIDFTVTLVSSTRYGDDRDITDTDYIDHLAIENAVYKHLQNHRVILHHLPGFAAVENTEDDLVLMESIVRVGTSTHQYIDNLMTTTATYRSKVYDYTATPEWQKILATLELDIQLTKTL